MWTGCLRAASRDHRTLRTMRTHTHLTHTPYQCSMSGASILLPAPGWALKRSKQSIMYRCHSLMCSTNSAASSVSTASAKKALPDRVRNRWYSVLPDRDGCSFKSFSRRPQVGSESRPSGVVKVAWIGRPSRACTKSNCCPSCDCCCSWRFWRFFRFSASRAARCTSRSRRWASRSGRSDNVEARAALLSRPAAAPPAAAAPAAAAPAAAAPAAAPPAAAPPAAAAPASSPASQRACSQTASSTPRTQMH